MKKQSILLLLAALAFFTLPSCKKDSGSSGPGGSPTGGNFGNHPRSEVPDELVGYWIAGSTSITNFWGYNGTYAGPAYELATGYMLYKDGRAKEYFMWHKTSTYCYEQILGYREGTVVVDKNAKTFEFYAASGNYRRYNGCGSSHSEGYGETKQYGSDDLYPAHKVKYNDWRLVAENGKQIWRIPMSDGSNLDFEKSQEPQQP